MTTCRSRDPSNSEADCRGEVTTTLIVYWSILEAGLGFIAAVLPPLSHLLRTMPSWNKTLSSLKGKVLPQSLRSDSTVEMIERTGSEKGQTAVAMRENNERSR